MKKLLSFILLISFYPAIAQKSHTRMVDNSSLNGLDTALQRALKVYQAPGFAVAVVRKNEMIYAKGFGYRDVAQKLPVTPNTVFAIASCTKAFTATLIGQLQKEGKLDIDKPVNSFMPSLRFYNDAMNNSITLRDMMAHRTGLPRHDLSWAFFPTLSRDSIIERIRYQQPTASVRERFQYNNFMYTAQGAVVEKLTGKSWEENIRQRIFEPLGMINSSPDWSDLYKSPEHATGYSVYYGKTMRTAPQLPEDAMAPCGGVSSTVLDMANWLKTWINGGKYKGKTIIPADFYQQAISSQMVQGSALPQHQEPGVYFATYGLAWQLSSYKGHYRVEHDGLYSGFTSSTCFFPTDSLGIVVLSNQDGYELCSVVRNLIADRLLGEPYDNWTDTQHQQDMEGIRKLQGIASFLNAPHQSKPATHPLTDFTGTYFNPGYGRFQVYLKNDSLWSKGSGGKGLLKHYSYDTFDFFVDDTRYGIDTGGIPFRVQFLMNPQGDIDGVSGVYQEGLAPIVFKKEK